MLPTRERKVNNEFRRGNLNGQDRFECLGVVESIILRLILSEYDVRSWIGLMLLRIETISGLL